MEVLVSSSMVEESYFDRQVNTKLSGTPYATLANTDSSNCLLECLLRRLTSHCAAFNWDTIKKSCELFIVDPYVDLTSNLTAVSGTNFYIQRNVLV
ncbi:fucolectin-7 [Biomphalaria pfeifferi]|uniref:Fucolectin-7 n=1 Tax=Biomphalaria pfeifferi TaxID=112525 RepID=A0AAD8BWG0_BIOPF|nr:fucolectin-7 [Biomphalaria pfeifferi]